MIKRGKNATNFDEGFDIIVSYFVTGSNLIGFPNSLLWFSFFEIIILKALC